MRGTKERIVDAGVQLFNRSGVGPVTTNHIAAHLGMSPGNLYYHFKNKEEIIRGAFDRMNAEADHVWRLDPALGPAALHRMLTGNLALYAKYLFFARELPALLRADPVLRRRYRKIHKVRLEQFSISASAARSINSATRIIAIGTTTVRVLESAARLEGKLAAQKGATDIFIHPPAEIRHVDALLTNFHLPRSTLLMLVSAFAGREFILNAYAEAILERYRFYSYGDCMLIM